jgi:pyruvate kinase
VANAVIDGTDALMLSAETAVSRCPAGSVEVMDRIIRKVENYGIVRATVNQRGVDMERGARNAGASDADTLAEAVCSGAVKVTGEVGASAIACLTHSGNTAMKIAKHRPAVPILALTDYLPVVRRMSLVWGVKAIPVESIESTEKIFAVVRDKIREEGHSGKVVFTAGIPTGERGPTNTVHVVHI